MGEDGTGGISPGVMMSRTGLSLFHKVRENKESSLHPEKKIRRHRLITQA